MVYYIKALANGLTKKVALPLVFAATALTPALAGNTTLKLVGPADNKIAYDETKPVELKLTSPASDQLSFVEVNVELPAGLTYVEGSFQKADIPALKAHQFKVTQTAKGIHVAIYSDNLAVITALGDMTDETIGTFQVKANTALTGEDGIGLNIVDLSDKDANHIDFNDFGIGYDDDNNPYELEGGEGDNSLGSGKVTVDKTKFPGEWNVYTVTELNADGQMEFNPVFDKHHITVNLKNDIAQISGLEFRIILPVGITLDVESLKENLERKMGQSLSSQVMIDTETTETTNDYKIFYLGGDKAFKGTDGVLIEFDVQADLTVANDPAKDFTDEIKLENIWLTDVNTVAVQNGDIIIPVFNPNEKAYYKMTNAENGTLTVIDNLRETDPYNRVYEYSGVLDARKAAADKMEDYHSAGLLAYNGNEAEVDGLIAAYGEELEADKTRNEQLYADKMQDAQDKQDELDAANQPQIVLDARGMAKVSEPEVLAAEPAEGSTYYQDQLDDFIDPALAAAYDAAKDAIAAYAQQVQDLYDQKTELDPEHYDGALLTDDDNPETSLVAAAAKAAKDAIDEFVKTRDAINEANKQKFEDLANGDLQQSLDDMVQYVKDLPTYEGTNKGAFYNEENFPEIITEITKAQEMIQTILSEDGVINNKYSDIALPYEEGIKPVLEAFDQVLDQIQVIKEVADQAAADNLAAYEERYTTILVNVLLDEEFPTPASEKVEQSDSYQTAKAAFEQAGHEYQDFLDAEMEQGTVAKHADAIDEAEQKLFDAYQQFKDAVQNLNDLDALIDEANTQLDNAKGELERILNDYEFMEEGVYTEDKINAIQDKIDQVENAINDLDDEINGLTGDDWKKLLNENGEVDDWKDQLNNILDQLNGTEEADGIDQDIDDAEQTYLKYHQLGDANMDGVVSVTDWFEIMDYAMGRITPMPADESDDQKVREKFSQLNVSKEDGDKKINVTDAVAVINLMQTGDIHGVEVPAGARANGTELVSAQTTMVNGVRRIALNLDNVQQYTAAQLDIVLPEGMKLVGATTATRTSRHDIDTNVMADGTVRLALVSKSNRAFEGNSGAVLYIDVEGAGEVQIENIELTTVNAFAAQFAIGETQTVGIDNAKVAAQGEQVYSIGGRLMNAMKKGINIIRRADGSAQKVIK